MYGREGGIQWLPFSDEAYSDKEVTVAVHTCMSFAPKIAVVVDNHLLLAICTSDVVEGNTSSYLLDNEPCDDEGRVAVYRLMLQGVDVDNHPISRCTESRWDPHYRMTGRPRHLRLAHRRGCSSCGALGGSA